jgi:hypothetical protein
MHVLVTVTTKKEANMSEEKYREIEGINADTYAGKAIMALKNKARGVMGDDLLTFYMVDFASFMMLNNKFASKGIFITDENKEEEYIKVIESGDISLIEDLETYINLRDKIQLIESQKKEYTSLVNQLVILEDHDDRDSVNGIVEEYLRR